MKRRTLLSAGSTAVLAIAAGSPVVGRHSVLNSPEVVIREYYSRADAVDTVDAFAADVSELSHSVSPLSDVAEASPGLFAGAVRQNLVDVEVVQRDVDAEQILSVSDFFAGSVTDEAVAAIVEENAVVAVTLESDRVGVGAYVLEWLVATDDGQWRLVWL